MVAVSLGAAVAGDWQCDGSGSAERRESGRLLHHVELCGDAAKPIPQPVKAIRQQFGVEDDYHECYSSQSEGEEPMAFRFLFPHGVAGFYRSEDARGLARLREGEEKAARGLRAGSFGFDTPGSDGENGAKYRLCVSARR